MLSQDAELLFDRYKEAVAAVVGSLEGDDAALFASRLSEYLALCGEIRNSGIQGNFAARNLLFFAENPYGRNPDPSWTAWSPGTSGLESNHLHSAPVVPAQAYGGLPNPAPIVKALQRAVHIIEGWRQYDIDDQAGPLDQEAERLFGRYKAAVAEVADSLQSDDVSLFAQSLSKYLTLCGEIREAGVRGNFAAKNFAARHVLFFAENPYGKNPDPSWTAWSSGGVCPVSDPIASELPRPSSQYAFSPREVDAIVDSLFAARVADNPQTFSIDKFIKSWKDHPHGGSGTVTEVVDLLGRDPKILSIAGSYALTGGESSARIRYSEHTQGIARALLGRDIEPA